MLNSKTKKMPTFTNQTLTLHKTSLLARGIVCRTFSLSAFPLVILFLTACGTTTSGTRDGAGVLSGETQEYQDLAREICTLIRDSTGTHTVISGTRKIGAQTANIGEMTTTHVGVSAQFVSPVELHFKRQMTVATVGSANPARSKISGGVKLTEVTGVLAQGAATTPASAVKTGDYLSAAETVDPVWAVMVGARSGVWENMEIVGAYGMRHSTSAVPPGLTGQVATLAYFDDKTRAELLAGKVRRLVALAKSRR